MRSTRVVEFAALVGLLHPCEALAQAAWQRVPNPASRSRPLLAFDTANNRVLAYGGISTTMLFDTWSHDGSQWTELSASPRPQLSHQIGMTFDSRRNVAVLVGAATSNDTPETWEFDGTQWSRRQTAVGLPRIDGGPAYTGMAYHAARGETVLVSTARSPATWTYDGATWRRVSDPPLAASFGPLAYDASRQQIVGIGWDGLSAGWRTFEWGGSSWRTITSPTPPPSASGAALAYDAATQRVVTFGDDGAQSRDLWQWNGVDWQVRAVPSAPPGRSSPGLIGDPVRGQVLLVAGWNGTSLGDTWALRGSQWTLLEDRAGPARVQHAMAFDTARNRAVLFGGLALGASFSARVPDGKTFEWDGQRWTDVSPSTSPSPRADAAMAYDAARGRTLLFGGRQDTTLLGDTWVWDGTAWTQLTTPTAPSPRSGSAMSYDSARQRIVLFGGRIGTSNSSSETWEWDGSQWSLRRSGFPPANAEVGMAYDARRRRTVLVTPAATGAAVWEWDGNVWFSTNPPSRPSEEVNNSVTYDPARARVVVGEHDNLARTASTWEWNGSTWQRTVNAAPRTALWENSPWVYDPVRERVLMHGGAGLATHSDVYGSTPQARDEVAGAGCSNTAGTPTLSSSGRPWLGDAVTVTCRGLAPGAAASLGLGGSDQTYLGVPLPIALDPFGFIGCALRVSLDVSLPMATAGSEATVPLTIPALADLVGANLFEQALLVHSGGALALSNSRKLTFGLR